MYIAFQINPNIPIFFMVRQILNITQLLRLKLEYQESIFAFVSGMIAQTKDLLDVLINLENGLSNELPSYGINSSLVRSTFEYVQSIWNYQHGELSQGVPSLTY